MTTDVGLAAAAVITERGSGRALRMYLASLPLFLPERIFRHAEQGASVDSEAHAVACRQRFPMFGHRIKVRAALYPGPFKNRWMSSCCGNCRQCAGIRKPYFLPLNSVGGWRNGAFTGGRTRKIAVQTLSSTLRTGLVDCRARLAIPGYVRAPRARGQTNQAARQP